MTAALKPPGMASTFPEPSSGLGSPKSLSSSPGSVRRRLHEKASSAFTLVRSRMKSTETSSSSASTRRSAAISASARSICARSRRPSAPENTDGSGKGLRSGSGGRGAVCTAAGSGKRMGSSVAWLAPSAPTSKTPTA